MYTRLQKASLWHGASLCEDGAVPLTHDILAALDLLEPKEDGSGDMEPFEETFDKQRMDSGYASSGPNSQPHLPPSGFFGEMEGPSPSDRATPTPPHLPSPATNAHTQNASSASTSSRSQWQSPRSNVPKHAPNNISQQYHPRPLLAKPTTIHQTPLQSPLKQLPPLDTAILSQIPPLVKDPQLYSPDWLKHIADQQPPQCARLERMYDSTTVRSVIRPGS
ncbi:hypothetical protein Q7P37_002731 [Cladosporium fusiforme]